MAASVSSLCRATSSSWGTNDHAATDRRPRAGRARPRSRRIFLQDLDLPVDIGFHAAEVGNPQRLLISVEVWVDDAHFAAEDKAAAAWNYDFVRSEIHRIVADRRFNLQETLVREIYAMIAARVGVTALRVATRKPDVYPDCRGVGVELASF